MPVYAWFSIAPEQEFEHTFHEDEGPVKMPGGTLAKLEAASWIGIRTKGNNLLAALGAKRTFRIDRTDRGHTLNGEGPVEVNQDEWSPWPTGLKWVFYPCRADGSNTDVEPNEPHAGLLER